MTDRSGGAGVPDDGSSAPVDFDRLDLITDRLATDERFDRIEDRPPFHRID